MVLTDSVIVWKTICRCLVEGEECVLPQEVCRWVFVNLAFCWAVEGWKVMMEGFCPHVLAEARCMRGELILICCLTPRLCRSKVAGVRVVLFKWM